MGGGAEADRKEQLFKGHGVYFQLELNCPSLHLSVLLSVLLHPLMGGQAFYNVPVTPSFFTSLVV